MRKGAAGFLLEISGPHIDGLPDHGLAKEKGLAAAASVGYDVRKRCDRRPIRRPALLSDDEDIAGGSSMKVLAYSSPSRGDLFPIVPVLLELVHRGHQVSVRTLDSVVPVLRGLGFDAHAVAPQIGSVVAQDYRAGNARAAIKSSLRTFAQRAPLEIADLRAAIDRDQPDLLLLDFNCWGAAVAAEQWGGPWARWCCYPLPLPSPDVPPFGPGFAPAHNRWGRVRDRVLSPLITGGFERIIIPQLNEVRRPAGLAPLDGVTDLIAQAPLTLSMTAEPLEYHRASWPASVKLIGACPWEPPTEPVPWLAEIDCPIVLVTTSSEFQNDSRLISCSLEALRDEPVFVVATAPAQSPGAFSPPGNARVETFIPHGQVLDRAVCAITHGGMGATQKSLAHGVPVCAVPFGRDQFEVARRVEVAGAGTRLPAKRLTAESLLGAVRSAMTMADGARLVARGFEDAGGPQAAADALEQLRT